MMKSTKFFQASIVLLVTVLVFSIQAQAALQYLGTDSLGYGLIYDNDLDITWYDYTNASDTWSNQVAWADDLSVNFDGSSYDDWRLPTAVDGQYSSGYDGTTTFGWNITTSELGHLYYTELGNDGWYDTSGNPTGCSGVIPYCLTNTGDFQTLQAWYYWSGTEYTAGFGDAFTFRLDAGTQDSDGYSSSWNAIAVRDGMATVVPEPISSTLFIVGGATLGFRRFRKKRSS